VSDALRVVTYNIRKGKGADGRSQVPMQRFGEALANHGVDLLLCQEVFHCARTGGSQSGGLAQAMGLSGYYGANKFRQVGHHGNTTLTRLEVEHFENHDISTNRLERRGVLYTRAWLGDRPLHTFNAHLGLNRWQRRTQIERIGALVERLCGRDEAVLIAGDFNDWRRELDRFVCGQLGFRDAHAEVAPEHARTWHARRPVFSLDRIYVRNLETTHADRLSGEPWSTLSDHLPLVAELEHD